jgi:hypothetical protein
MSHISVIDSKGIVLGTWKQGKVVALKRGDRIDVTGMGAWKVGAELLNVPREVQDKLIAKGRVAVHA